MRAQIPERTSWPSSAPLSLAEVRAHLRIEHTDEDAILSALIYVATDYLDGYSGTLGRALITQTWRQDWSGFPLSRWLSLPLAPVQSVTVEYYNAIGGLKTLSPQLYHLVALDQGPFVALDDDASWPTTADRPDAVRVTAVCGYGSDEDDVPRPIRQAMLLMIGDLYEHRETVAMGASPATVPISLTVNRLLAPYRRV